MVLQNNIDKAKDGYNVLVDKIKDVEASLERMKLAQTNRSKGDNDDEVKMLRADLAQQGLVISELKQDLEDTQSSIEKIKKQLVSEQDRFKQMLQNIEQNRHSNRNE